MERWTDAVYEATGIPLSEEDVRLVCRDGEWWLLVFGHPVRPLGPSPDPTRVVTPALRQDLARALQARLSWVLPRVLRLVESLDPVGAGQVTAAVVNAEDPQHPLAGPTDPERGWPHFGLRLSSGDLDVEVDINPYQPDEPVDLEEVARQASVLLQAVRSV